MNLTAYEKELCKKGNIFLLNVIITAAIDTGYYITKAGDKMYVAVDARDPEHKGVFAVTSRVEDGESMGYLAYFNEGVLMNELFEEDPSFLPAECPTIISLDEEKPVVIIISAFDKSDGISFTYKGTGYMTSVTKEFDPEDTNWWGSFILNTIPELESVEG